MLARGKGKLLPFLASCQGIDLARLLADLEQCEKELRHLGAEGLTSLDRFPCIHVVR